MKNDEKLKPSDHIKIVQTSPTTVEIQITKAKPEDQGDYTVVVDNQRQPLIKLKVIPKPVTRQTLDLPQTTFNEGDTLTINCQFDSVPDESFEFLRNGQPLISDNRITTIVENTTYTIVVKGLRPNEDEGVYTFKSEHLILDTPSITVVSTNVRGTPESVQNVVEEIEEETIIIEPTKKSDVVDIEIVEKEKDKVSDVFTPSTHNLFHRTNVFRILTIFVLTMLYIFYSYPQLQQQQSQKKLLRKNSLSYKQMLLYMKKNPLSYQL